VLLKKRGVSVTNVNVCEVEYAAGNHVSNIIGQFGRLSYHITKISTSGFYNAMELGEISTRPN